MTDYMREIAKIESTRLGYEDHGILTSMLFVTYGGGLSQGVGGYCLDRFDKEADRRVGTDYGLEFIARTLKACGVETWERVTGRTIYVLQDAGKPMGFGHKVVGIENLPTEPGARFLFADLDYLIPERVSA